LFERIRRLVKSDSVPDIRAALEEIDLDKLRSDLAAAQAKRTRLLLEGDDAAVLAAEKDIESARLAFDRAEAARGELQSKLAAAIAKEVDDIFERHWNEVDADAKATFDFIRSKVVPAARVIEEALARKEASDQKITELNRIIIANIHQDSAAGRSGAYGDHVMRRLREADILPSWLAGMLEHHSTPY